MANPPSTLRPPSDIDACVARIRAKAKPIEELKDWHAMYHRLLGPERAELCEFCTSIPA